MFLVTDRSLKFCFESLGSIVLSLVAEFSTTTTKLGPIVIAFSRVFGRLGGNLVLSGQCLADQISAMSVNCGKCLPSLTTSPNLTQIWPKFSQALTISTEFCPISAKFGPVLFRFWRCEPYSDQICPKIRPTLRTFD